MFEIEKIFRFEAGHCLHHHDGQCSQPHGHSYVLSVIIRAKDLVASGPKKNMVVDFGDLSESVKPMIDNYFEHKWLNDTLETDSPTAEYIAKWIYNHLKPGIPNLYSISLYETASSRATYTE